MGFKAFDNNWFDIWILEECVRTQEARMEPKQSHEYCNESTPLTAHSQSVKLSYPQAPTDPDTMRWIGDINTRGALNNSSNIDSQSIQVFGLAIVLDPAPPRSKQLIAASIGQSLVAGKHCTACVSLDLPEMGRSESWVGIRLLFAVMVVTVLCVLTQVSVAQQQYASSGVGAIVTRAMFDDLWPNRNASFYTYAAFIAAAKCYPKFGTEGTQAQKLREIAAFAAHVQQETAGLYYINEIDQSNSYCDSTNTQYPCAPGQKYFGRGPLQLSWNFNYGAASRPVGYNILADPGQVAKDPILAFKSSLWFWNTASGSEPSIHNVLVGKWIPSAADISANRTVGFGVTIDIINGGLECGKTTAQASNRVKYFKQFASQLGVDPGQNLDCANMKPF